MQVALQDLGLQHVRVLYPGRLRCPLSERITAFPLRQLPELALGSK